MITLNTLKEIRQSFGDMTIEVEIVMANNKTYKRTIENIDDLFNEAIPEGSTITLLMTNGQLLTGQYGGIEDEDDGFYLFLRSNCSRLGISIPVEKIVGYFNN